MLYDVLFIKPKTKVLPIVYKCIIGLFVLEMIQIYYGINSYNITIIAFSSSVN